MNKQKYPRLQLRTVRELMEGKGIERPSNVAAVDETFKKAPKAKGKGMSGPDWSFENSPALQAPGKPAKQIHQAPRNGRSTRSSLRAKN